MKNYILVVLSTLTITVATGQLNAQTVPPEAPKKHKPEEVLAYQGDAVLTHDMMEGAFSRIPEDLRLIFVRDGEKVDQLVRSLLQSEVVAMDAEKSDHMCMGWPR